mgnify:CR=1 FL=1
MTYKAHIFGFDPEMANMVGEAMFFAGAEPVKFPDVAAFTKTFRQDPPAIIVSTLATIRRLDLNLMMGGDERFDSVAVLAAVEDPYDRTLPEALETCALDYFLMSQPYHLKRLALAIMSKNPWSEAPATSGKLILAEPMLERRIAVARALRIALFDVVFVDTIEDLAGKLRGHDHFSIAIVESGIAGLGGFEKLHEDTTVRRLPWIVYGDREVLANTEDGHPERLARVGTESNPDAILFHVQEILKKPLKDLRQSRRIPLFTPIRFQVDTIQDAVWAFTRDMSQNGLFVRTVAPPPPETMLTVSFKPPTGEGNVQVGARVAWRKECGQKGDAAKPVGMGIQFTRVSPPDGAAIEAGHRAAIEAMERRGSV